MDVLKPCPFCGELPSSGVEFCESYGGNIKLRATVYCPSCHINKGYIFKATDEISIVPFLDYEIAFDKVKKMWNERSDQWTLCENTVDIPDHEILACDKYGEMMFGYLSYEDEQWICDSNHERMYDVVAWCEKPQPYIRNENK